MTSPARQRLLVTGGRGLLGNAVITKAVARGWQVRALQRHPSGVADGESVVDITGSITDPASIERAIEGCDAVIHLAARVGIEGRWSDFESVNVVGTEMVLDAARRAGVESFVHVSSPSVAHAGRALEGADAAPADPTTARGHYSRSKAMAEQLALATKGLPVVAIRPHLVWGPGDEQLVGRIVSRARSGRLFVIDGGRALIDTTYIDNAADAIVHALGRTASSKVQGRAFVISNGEPRPVREIVESIVRAAGVDTTLKSVPFAPAFAAGAVGEWWGSLTHTEPLVTRFLVEQLATAHWFDPRPSWDDLEWRPTIGLDEGMRRLAAHYQR
ncbi:MAG: NAD-dependent epimerase/dehydratase family protein [Actinomycetota bacterium]|nr:NAD-dependent epimerase/dehydratase family protein [Actinomycetota bacterium]